VPILAYHAIVAQQAELAQVPPGARLYVFTIEELCRHLDHLATEGFTTIALGGLVRWHQGAAELPERAIVVSFDDGHRSNAELALPALQARGQKAIFFITAGRVESEDSVTWAHLRAMLGAGMEIGSHTLTHPCPSSLSRDALRHELAESKRLLEEGTGAPVEFVASPTGYDSRHFAALAREAGYRAALQGVIGRNRRSTGLFALRRFVLKRSFTFEAFRRLVDPSKRAYVALRARQMARNVVRRVIGVRGYESIRRLLLGAGKSATAGSPSRGHGRTSPPWHNEE